MTWDAPAGATHYDVTYHGGGVDARGAWNRAGTTLTITCDVRAGHENCVSGGTAYTVGVRARNAGGQSAWRNSAEASLAAPGPVTNIRVAHLGTSLDVSWDAPTGATHYDVTYYRHDTEVNARAAWNRKGTSLTITKDSRSGHENRIESGATYTVGVRARNAAGASAWANSGKASASELSVADASVAEPSEDLSASLDFEVTLEPASSGTVTVGYATGGGNATAGSDYTSTSGRLTFAAGETSKTVSVPVLADSHDDAGETLTLTLSNASGASISDATATGTITNDGPLPKAWTARFGRTVAETHVDAVRARMGADRSPGFSGTLAGQPLPRPEAGAEGVPAFRPPAVPESGEDARLAFRSFLADDDEGEDGEGTTALTAGDALAGTSFSMMMRDSGTGLSHGFWGRAARSGFSGRDGTVLDGAVTSVMLGTDWKRKGTLFGLMVSESRGTGTYGGEDASQGGIDARMAALVPYAGLESGEGLSAWGAAGIGRGEMTLTPEGSDPVGCDVAWSMAAAGAAGALVPGGGFGGADLDWHADALWTRTTSDATRSGAGNLAASAGTTVRLRLGLRAAWEQVLASGATLRPRLEAGLRHDGGDAETGAGLEIGGGVAFADAGHGLTMSLDARTLALHEDGGFRDWGVGFSVSYDPNRETKRGLSVLATRTLGGASSGGVDALLGPEAFPSLAGTDGAGDWSVEGAYGFGRGRGMVGSPYGRAGGSDGVDSLRLGYRIWPDAAHAADASVDLWAEPDVDGGGGGAGAELQWRW